MVQESREESQRTCLDLAQLGEQLQRRGWQVEDDSNDAWEWFPAGPGGSSKDTVLFRSGACVWFESDESCFLVEGPILHDEPSVLLRYQTADQLLASIEKIEHWTYPMCADQIDGAHLNSNPPRYTEGA